jgi:hypothetical protein
MYRASINTYNCDFISALPFSVINLKVSKVHPIFSKFRKTVNMSSTTASITQQEETAHGKSNSSASRISSKEKSCQFTQGNSNQQLYSYVRNERQMYNKDPQVYDSIYYKRLAEKGFQ